jgi:hypothetical protein
LNFSSATRAVYFPSAQHYLTNAFSFLISGSEAVAGIPVEQIGSPDRQGF